MVGFSLYRSYCIRTSKRVRAIKKRARVPNTLMRCFNTFFGGYMRALFNIENVAIVKYKKMNPIVAVAMIMFVPPNLKSYIFQFIKKF